MVRGGGGNPTRRSTGRITILVAAMVLTFGIPASGAEPEPELLREVELEPSAQAEVVLSDVRARFWSDGSVELTVEDAIDAQATILDGEPLGIRFQVDPETDTYTSERLTSQEVDALLEEVQQVDVANQSVIPTEEAPAPGASGGNARKISVLMITTEILGAIVAWTEYERAWTVANPIQEMYAGIYCRPTYITFLGTHWFNDICTLLPTWNLGSFNCRPSFGGYYNWDFACNCEPTYADHYMNLCGDPSGNGAYALTWYHYGEWGWLLSGYAYVLWFTSV
jgi:hypothetical protein